MTVDEDVMFAAMRSGDARFDGKFFIAVKTTKIYCRPVCPARPHRRNVVFFPNSLAAEKAGFRPCLRCRPESAPRSAAWQGTSAIVNRGLQRIFTHPNDTFDDAEFASNLGVGARHLRRLFIDEIGKTPKQVYDIRRLDFARKLVIETTLPIAHIAHAIGLSIRRFNEAFAGRFRRTPIEMRKLQPGSCAAAASSNTIILQLAYRPPLHWPAMLQWLAVHAISAVESVDDESYRRVFRCGNAIASLRVSQTRRPRDATDSGRVDTGPHHLQLELTNVPDSELLTVVHRVRQLLDLDSDPLRISEHLSSQSPLMAKLVTKYPGLRVPHGWDGFEVGVCAMLGQLVSTAQAKRLVTQLVVQHGAAAINPFDGQPCRLFPTPDQLANGSLRTVATSEARRKNIRTFATAIATGRLTLHPYQDAAELKQTLRALPGIGPWTAEYIAMRTLHDCDAFPGTDLILARVLTQHPTLRVAALAPWRSYVAVYLWHEFAIQRPVPTPADMASIGTRPLALDSMMVDAVKKPRLAERTGRSKRFARSDDPPPPDETVATTHASQAKAKSNRLPPAVRR